MFFTWSGPAKSIPIFIKAKSDDKRYAGRSGGGGPFPGFPWTRLQLGLATLLNRNPLTSGKIPGANGDAQAGKALVMKNADKMPKTKMPGAPKRVEMPVIDTPKVAMVVKKLAAGEVDLKAPYSPGVTPVQADGYKKIDTKIKEIINLS